ncbi:MAG: hypothetical protein KDC35_11275 [Acidobacteria bacterium]|nr:hypothetical protein [Acidobacteriota bacterium]
MALVWFCFQLNVIYEQLAQPGTGAAPSYVNPVFSDAVAADDFTVPVGDHWSVRSIVIRGRHANDCRPKAFLTPARVRLYADKHGLPGVLLKDAQDLQPGEFGSDVAITLPQSWSLNAGTYWLEVSLQSAGGCVWFWHTQSSQLGAPFALLNHGPWTPCGGQNCSNLNPDLNWDLSFALHDAPLIISVPTLPGKMGLLLFVSLLGISAVVTQMRDKS